MAQVFWNTKTHDVFIADVSLPQAPSNKQYQLWAIVDGKPVDAGMISDAKNLAQKMKVFEKADAFAITLEKRGGSATPTMEEIYVMGKS
jgi:anti-sigma-K factor RskA